MKRFAWSKNAIVALAPVVRAALEGLECQEVAARPCVSFSTRRIGHEIFYPRRMEIKLSRRCQTQSRRQTLRLRGTDKPDENANNGSGYGWQLFH
jgi:hypothetical protein